MSDPLPIVLIPGLALTAELYAEQIPALWHYGPVTIADHRRDEHVAAIARRILADAPPRFALVGLSMGGYISFEILRQARERVLRLALLDTTAMPDLPEQSARRREMIERAQRGRLAEIAELLYPRLVHPARHADAALRASVTGMIEQTGAEAFVRQELAILSRPDSRPDLPAIICPTLILVGESDELTPVARAIEMASAIRGAHLRVVPDSGHLSTIEQPHAVTAALTEWLGAPSR